MTRIYSMVTLASRSFAAQPPPARRAPPPSPLLSQGARAGPIVTTRRIGSPLAAETTRSVPSGVSLPLYPCTQVGGKARLIKPGSTELHGRSPRVGNWTTTVLLVLLWHMASVQRPCLSKDRLELANSLDLWDGHWGNHQ
jgi:hypothetical protein